MLMAFAFVCFFSVIYKEREGERFGYSSVAAGYKVFLRNKGLWA